MVSCANVKAKTLTLIMYTKHTGIVGEWADAKVGGGCVGGWVGGVNSVKTIEHAVEGVFPQVLTCKKTNKKQDLKNVKRCKPERGRGDTFLGLSQTFRDSAVGVLPLKSSYMIPNNCLA